MHRGKKPDVQLCVQADAGTGSSHHLAALPARLNTALGIKGGCRAEYGKPSPLGLRSCCSADCKIAKSVLEKRGGSMAMNKCGIPEVLKSAHCLEFEIRSPLAHRHRPASLMNAQAGIIRAGRFWLFAPGVPGVLGGSHLRSLTMCSTGQRNWLFAWSGWTSRCRLTRRWASPI